MKNTANPPARRRGEFETFVRVTLKAIVARLDAQGALLERLRARDAAQDVELARLKAQAGVWTGLLAAAVSGAVALLVRALGGGG
jgi:hypothetical protein